MSKTWVEFRKTPCPVCGHKGWCAFKRTEPNKVMCMRVYDRPNRAGGQVHDLGSCHELPRQPIPEPKPHNSKADIQRKMALAWAHTTRRGIELLSELIAKRMSLSHTVKVDIEPCSLEAVGACYTDTVWYFPMHDAAYQICGIRIRDSLHRKWAVRGSQNGLFFSSHWPTGKQPIWIVEGPTDCAAMHQIGLPCIGRPDARGCRDMLVSMMSNMGVSRCVIVADADRPDKMGRCPGPEGARDLAKDLQTRRIKSKIIRSGHYKDALEAVMVGGWKASDFRRIADRTMDA